MRKTGGEVRNRDKERREKGKEKGRLERRERTEERESRVEREGDRRWLSERRNGGRERRE